MNPETRSIMRILTESLSQFERVIRRRRFGFQSFIYFPKEYADPLLEKRCLICNKTFHFFRRDFYCQLCGHMVCGNCSELHEVEARIGDIRKNRCCRLCVVRVDAGKFDGEDLLAALGPMIVETRSDAWLPTDSMSSIDEEDKDLMGQLCSDDPKARSHALEQLGKLVANSSVTEQSSGRQKTQVQDVLSNIESHLNEELSKAHHNSSAQACDVSDRTRDYKYEFDANKVTHADIPLAPKPEAQKDARRVELIESSGALQSNYDRSALNLIAQVAAKRLGCPIGVVSMIDDQQFHAVGSYNLPAEARRLPRNEVPFSSVMASLSLRSLLRRAPCARFPVASFHSSTGSLRTRATERSQTGPSVSSSHDSTSPLISVRNAATSHGQLDVLLPLPGVKGLTRLGLDDASASVQDLIEAVRHADASLKAVEIATPDGTKLARTVRLGELTSMAFCLRLNHVNVLVESDVAAMDDRKAREESVAFATVKAEIERDSRLILPLHEFYRMCHNAGAEEKVATKWLRELQRRNLVVHFDRSRNPQLENAVILRPYSSESVLTLQNALDSELYNIKHDRRVKERQLSELNSKLKKLQQVENEVHVAARRMPNAQKWVGLTGLTGFYGALMYCPITYFIGFTAVLGNSFYSSITKKKRYADRVEMLSKQRKLDPVELKKLKACIADLENDVTFALAVGKSGRGQPEFALRLVALNYSL
ncbi:hypothetical protein PInf_011465 [Phytophthora infestans]|nr:hypothetical protein PInf_011465 [Phytophthora infestans]